MIKRCSSRRGFTLNDRELLVSTSHIESPHAYTQNNQLKLGPDFFIVDTKLFIFILSPFVVIFLFVLALLAFKALRRISHFKNNSYGASTTLLHSGDTIQKPIRRSKSKSTDPYLPFDTHKPQMNNNNTDYINKYEALTSEIEVGKF